MARAHRVALILTIVATSYLLCLFGVLSVPLVDPKVSEQILPVVRPIPLHIWRGSDHVFWNYAKPYLKPTGFLPIRKMQISAGPICASLLVKSAPMVATGCIRIVLSLVIRDGSSYLARMSRSLRWAAESKCFAISFPFCYLEDPLLFWRLVAKPENRRYPLFLYGDFLSIIGLFSSSPINCLLRVSGLVMPIAHRLWGGGCRVSGLSP